MKSFPVYQAFPKETFPTLVKRARGHWTMIPPGNGFISDEAPDATLERLQYRALDGFDKSDPQFAYDNMIDMAPFEEAEKRAADAG